MYKLYKAEELDVEEVKYKIKESNIKKSSHVNEVELRKGRPKWSLVENQIQNKLDSLYKAIKGRKDRLILYFYLSKKYDLRVVVRIKEKDLYVITFYHHLKKR